MEVDTYGSPRSQAFPFEVMTDINGTVWYATFRPDNIPVAKTGLSVCCLCGQIDQVCCDDSSSICDDKIVVYADTDKTQIMLVEGRWSSGPMCGKCCIYNGTAIDGAHEII